MTPKSSSLTLMSRNAVARTVPSSIGTSYVLPVGLSVIVSESDAVATPPPFVLCSSVPISLLGWEGVQDCSPHCGGGPPARTTAPPLGPAPRPPHPPPP